MSTAGTDVAVVQDPFGFLKSKTPSKDGINPPAIKCVSDNDVLSGLISNSSTISACQIGCKFLCLEITDDVSIPQIRSVNEEEGLVGRVILRTSSVFGEGSRHISSAKTSDFLDFAFSNSRSNSWRITIHLEYFPPSTCFVRMCCMGLQSDITVVFRSKM